MSFGKYIEVGRMDDLGRMDSPVHRLDARIKAVTTIVFIVAVMSFPRYEISALIPFFLYPIVLLAAGGIPPGYLLRKLLIASPFALAVGVFNPFLDRQVIMSLGPFGISGGWVSFASIVLRFALTVSSALILVSCTGIHRLCAGLERLGLPRVFSVQLQMLYRYLFVIAGEGLRMIRGVEMRSVGKRSIRLNTYVSLIGHLLVRAMDRAQRVYQAMVSRGFDGKVRVMRPAVARIPDLAFLFGWILFFSVARLWNVSAFLGNILINLSEIIL
jgi:cobalt/nickel transport system permease protein